MLGLACCQGAICKGCVQKWVANRIAWPEGATREQEVCPRCGGGLKGAEVQSLVAEAKADRASHDGDTTSNSTANDFCFAGIRQRLPTLAACDIASSLWKLVWTCGEQNAL